MLAAVGKIVAIAGEQISLPTVPSKVLDVTSQQAMTAGAKLETVALSTATSALARAVLSEAKTTDDKIPMMAMTTKSSIKVKPLLRSASFAGHAFLNNFIIFIN